MTSIRYFFGILRAFTDIFRAITLFYCQGSKLMKLGFFGNKIQGSEDQLSQK